MGLLIFQRKDKDWMCSITEEWAIDTIVDALKLQEFLMKNQIVFSVEYSFELVHITFEKSVYHHRQYDDFKKVVDKLMDYKKKYGDFKDLGELIKQKEKSWRGIKESELKTGGK